MANYIIEFRRQNEPIVGAEVTASGERIYGITDSNGQISVDINYNAPIAVHFHVKAENFQSGSGPHRLEPNETTVIRL